MVASWRRCAFALTGAAYVLAASAGPARAADLAKKWEVGAGVAYSLYDNDSTLADNPATSVRGGYHFGPNHGAELSLQFQSTESGTKGLELDYDVRRWAVNYLYDLKSKKPESKLAPVILFGVGQMNWEAGGEKAGSTLFQAGGGLRVLFTPWLALRVEGRLFHYHGDGEGLIPRDGFFGFDADVGVSFFFGG